MRPGDGPDRSGVTAAPRMAPLGTALLCAAALAIGAGAAARAGEAPPAGAATAGDKAAAEARKLAAKVLQRQQGLAEARAVELMGTPTLRATTDGGVTLTWGGAGDACVMTAVFRGGALGGIILTPGAGSDKKACKARAKPLLDAAPAPGSPAAVSAASLMTLTNDSIIEMVKEGRPAQAIIARVRTEPCTFDLSVEATMKLRREGVGESVIQAMTDRGCH